MAAVSMQPKRQDVAAAPGQPLALYQAPDGRRFIGTADHQRILSGLARIADAMGEVVPGSSIPEKMRLALQDGRPRGGGFEGAKLKFGVEFEAMAHLAAPVVTAVDGMLPGFQLWLEVTRFGDDHFMISAMVEIANKLTGMKKPSDARQRPNTIRLPKFH